MSDIFVKNQGERKATTSPERALAAFVGAAVGDALGWPFEGRAESKIDVGEWDGRFVSWKKRNGSRFSPWWEQVNRGEYSDDTQLILAVARSRETGPNWCEHFARVELPFWMAYERGGGGATKRAATSWLTGAAPWDSVAKDVAKRYFEAGGNGAAMRILPHCVAHAGGNEFSALSKDIFADAVTTHGHPRALLGALAFAYVLWSALRRTETLDYGYLLRLCAEDVDVWGALPDISDVWPTWRSAAEHQSKDFAQTWTVTMSEVVQLARISVDALEVGLLSDDPAVLKALGGLSVKTNGAGTVTAVAATYFASRYAASPAEGLRRAASAFGADTDTLASMTASLLGAINGMPWLKTYQSDLQDGDYIQKTAETLVFKGKTESVCDRLEKRDIAAIVAHLRNPDAAGGTLLPIGMRVTGLKQIHEVSGGRVIEAVRVVTDRGLTLIVGRNALKSSPTPQSFDDATKTFDSAKANPVEEQREQPQTAEDEPADADDFEPTVGMSLLVRSLANSREFYEGQLGLKVTGITKKSVRFSSALVLREDRQMTSPCEGVKLFVNVPDMMTCSTRLRAAGLALSEFVVRDDTRSFETRDPTGYLVEVFERSKNKNQ